MLIADCHGKHSPESEAERVANARLIAAAPDLLAAALLLVSDWKWKGGTTYTAHHTQPLIDAIAKAIA